jgi:hypothetical protein
VLVLTDVEALQNVEDQAVQFLLEVWSNEEVLVHFVRGLKRLLFEYENIGIFY